MKLRIFQSDHGDCILLQSNDGRNILCDGGMRSSMKRSVRGKLRTLVGANGKIDFAYVSHIDQDHISGVLQLLEDTLAWRVYDHHGGQTKKPEFPRPPQIGGIWHNSFRDQVSKNRGDIEELLAAAAPLLFGSELEGASEIAQEIENIATSIPEAIKVSRLAKPDLLDIPINLIPGQTGPAKLLFFRDQVVAFRVGSLKLTIIGPGKEELATLRKGWDNWLRDNEDDVRKIRKEMKRRVDEFASNQLSGSPFDLRDWNGVPDYKGVTAPNIASLMFLVEENGKTVLLTGDSQQEYILKGLMRAGLLDSGGLHLNALKVQHHGSENNVDKDFCRAVSADHYVFCGDGSNGNPEPSVIDIIYKSRTGPASQRSRAPEAEGRRFTFWFSTSSAHITSAKSRSSFNQMVRKVTAMASASGGRLTCKFNRQNYSTLTL